jgi:phosphate transport system substrate-binding protein
MARLSFLVLAGALLGRTSFAADLTGSLRVDGSSTVYPITSAVAEEFNKQPNAKNVKVTVAYSGTGGGFKKWCLGETDINDASRPIKDEEKKCAEEHKISYLEIPVAYDGLSVVTSTKNKFVKSLTLAQLKKIWEPGSTVKSWKDVDPSFPAEDIKLFGAGTDSGTFDYFTEEVNGKARASRSDYTASEDDNVLVKGVAASANSLGYFGFAYYKENEKTLRAIPLDKGKGAVAPSDATIVGGTYPLSRKIYIYVSDRAAARPEVQAFVKYYLQQAADVSHQVGYTPLKADEYKKALQAFEKFTASKANKG